MGEESPLSISRMGFGVGDGGETAVEVRLIIVETLGWPTTRHLPLLGPPFVNGRPAELTVLTSGGRRCAIQKPLALRAGTPLPNEITLQALRCVTRRPERVASRRRSPMPGVCGRQVATNISRSAGNPPAAGCRPQRGCAANKLCTRNTAAQVRRARLPERFRGAH